MSDALPRRPRRGGFTVAEVMVAVAIIAIIASIALPNILNYLDQQKVTSAKASIDSVVAGVARFKTAVNKYPSVLNMLTDSIRTTGGGAGNGNTVSRNSCTGYAIASATGTFAAADVTSWNNNGTFFSMPLTTSGYPIVIGTFNNSLVRVPSTVGSGQLGELNFIAPGVRTDDIEALEQLYDPETNSAAGIIRWGVSVDGTATMTYVMKIRGC